MNDAEGKFDALIFFSKPVQLYGRWTIRFFEVNVWLVTWLENIATELGLSRMYHVPVVDRETK